MTIPLTQGKLATVDAADYAWLSRFKWCAEATRTGGFYAHRWGPGGATVRMHAEILKPLPGFVTHHVNGQTLDNRQGNLMAVTPQQNQWARRKGKRGLSVFKGVTRVRKTGLWMAQISKNGKRARLGCYTTEVDAALAYDAAAREMFGPFAVPNFAHSVSRRWVRRFIRRTRGWIFRVHFIKRGSGKERRMVCRIGVGKGTKGTGRAVDLKRHRLISVYDMARRAYRFIPIDSLEAITFRGVNYVVRD